MIYLDNAATTYPKPKPMGESMLSCIENYCGNPGRSGHKMSMKTSEKIFKARNQIAKLLHAEDGERIIFTSNATESLNLAIKGVLCQGDHVITTAMEHNSVLRPLKALEEFEIETTVIQCNQDGTINICDVEKNIRRNTKLIICTHASNVTGTIMPVEQLIQIAKAHGILFLLDASQSAGVLDIHVKDWDLDMLAAPGHKSLMGPQGTGILYVKEGLYIRHLKHGGTGTNSLMLDQPDEFPDGYEAGTVNAPGIVGLYAALRYIGNIGIQKIRTHEQRLICKLDQELRCMSNITVYGPKDPNEKTGIVAFNVINKECEEVARCLDKDYDIAARAGYHCAPLAHKTIGTYGSGAVRLSVGMFNTKQEIEKTIDAIYKIQK